MTMMMNQTTIGMSKQRWNPKLSHHPPRHYRAENTIQQKVVSNGKSRRYSTNTWAMDLSVVLAHMVPLLLV
jgi:hypothetical protein